MTIALAICLVLTVAGFLALLDRKDDRDREERQLLLQRIQAPQAAVVDYSQRDQSRDPEPYPMTDEQMAADEERRQALQFVDTGSMDDLQILLGGDR